MTILSISNDVQGVVTSGDRRIILIVDNASITATLSLTPMNQPIDLDKLSVGFENLSHEWRRNRF